MKKLLLVIAMVAAGFTANAQDGKFNLGANIAIPTGDADTGYDFALSLEANYLFSLSDQFELGPSISYSHFFGGEVFGFEVEDASFIPVAAAARFGATDKFTIGLDLGYGIGISPDANDGGFYYRPLVGYNVSEKIMIQATYSGVSVEGGTMANIGLGAAFSL